MSNLKLEIKTMEEKKKETKEKQTQVNFYRSYEKIKLENVKNIILPGGLLKGYCYIGLIKYLNEKNIFKEIDNILGVSIGGFAGILFLLKYTEEEIHEFVINNKIDIFENLSINSLLDFNIHYGIDNGLKLNQLFKNVIYKKTNNYYLTFKQLYDLTDITFTIVGTNLNLINYDYFNHILTPDMQIWLALRITTNIPVYFNSIKYNDNQYIDGGVSNNIPLEYLLNKNIDINSIIILIFDEEGCYDYDNSMFCFLKHLINNFKIKEKNVLEKDYEKNIINIKTTLYSYKENISNEEIFVLANNGYNNVKDYFET